MVKLWGRNKGAYALAAVPLVADCGTLRARPVSCLAAGSVRGGGAIRAAGGAWVAGRGRDLAGFAADDLGQYRLGTALDAKSCVTDDGYLAPASTTDGAHRTSDTPPAARALLATPDAAVVLQALDGQRAWLAVTAATTDSSPVHLTEVFTTFTGGRT